MLDLETFKGNQAARNGACVKTHCKSTSSSLPKGVGLAITITFKNGHGDAWAQRWPLPGQAHIRTDGKPIRKAHSLIDKVYSWPNLMAAWRAVRRNKEAHGLDLSAVQAGRVTIQELTRNLEQNLSEIQRKLQQDRFRPYPVRPACGRQADLYPEGLHWQEAASIGESRLSPIASCNKRCFKCSIRSFTSFKDMPLILPSLLLASAFAKIGEHTMP